MNLKSLRLASNKLGGGLPEALGAQFAHCLEELDLSSCELATLSDSFCSLSKLTKLDLSNNRLTALPPAIGSLLRLVELNINNNAPLKDIPSTFGHLTHLHDLSVANVRISRDSYGLKKAEIIDEKLQKFSRLIRMCLSSGGHPDLVFAMRYLATKRTIPPHPPPPQRSFFFFFFFFCCSTSDLVSLLAKYLKKMVDRGVSQELLRLGRVGTPDKHVQEAALSTLLTLASVPENRGRLLEEPGLVQMCCDLIAHEDASIDRVRLVACDVICCLAFEDQLRYKIVQQFPQVLVALRKQLDRSAEESIAVIHHAQRALSALGDSYILDRFARKRLPGAAEKQDGIRLVLY